MPVDESVEMLGTIFLGRPSLSPGCLLRSRGRICQMESQLASLTAWIQKSIASAGDENHKDARNPDDGDNGGLDAGDRVQSTEATSDEKDKQLPDVETGSTDAVENEGVGSTLEGNMVHSRQDVQSLVALLHEDVKRLREEWRRLRDEQVRHTTDLSSSFTDTCQDIRNKSQMLVTVVKPDVRSCPDTAVWIKQQPVNQLTTADLDMTNRRKSNMTGDRRNSNQSMTSINATTTCKENGSAQQKTAEDSPSKSTAFFRRNDPVSGIQSWSKTQSERSAVVRLFGSSSSPVPQSPLLNSNTPDKQSNFPAFKQTDTDPDIIRVNASANESQPCSEGLRSAERPETTPKRLPPPVIPQRKSSFTNCTRFPDSVSQSSGSTQTERPNCEETEPISDIENELTKLEKHLDGRGETPFQSRYHQDLAAGVYSNLNLPDLQDQKLNVKDVMMLSRALLANNIPAPANNVQGSDDESSSSVESQCSVKPRNGTVHAP